MSKSISETFTLYDDDSVREKLTVMDKWEAMMDDARNSHEFGDVILEFLELGKSYKITIEEVTHA